ncbi:MAG: riboflavin biosynthesis protein RibD, partial [Methylococcaceae bacterium]|nr:riboflavin biosynthesis protein RibD [Methylococcaceae bacterium]
SSLDGRIAVGGREEEMTVPKVMTSANDFRLLQELEAQADCIVVHGAYLRALAAGRLGNVLQIGQRDSGADLAGWRRENGLSPQPAIAIVSASLDFSIPDSIRAFGQTCFIATCADAAPERMAHWRNQGHEVVAAGQSSWVEAAALVQELGRRGFRSVYLGSGPRLLESMVRDGCLDALFHTITHQLLGGESPVTMISGGLLGDAGRLRLRSLYYDPAEPAGAGQFFAHYGLRGKRT